MIAVDAAQLRRLAPDLIISQGLCEVCAVAEGEVHRLAVTLPHPPRVLSLSASSLDGIFEDIRAVAGALRLESQADELIAGLEARLRSLRAGAPSARRRVVCIEWLEPLYLAGHWVPELVAVAGGRDVGASPGCHSVRRDWADLLELSPELIVVMLCGFDPARAERELDAVTDPTARAVLRQAPVWILDGNAYTSRPGPRVVDGAERLHAMLAGREAAGLRRWQAPWVA